MTDDDKAIQEAEAILAQAEAEINAQQSKEHIASMPHLYRMTKQLITEKGKDHCPVHLAIIRQSDDAPRDTDYNPLGITGEERMTAQLALTHSFSTYDLASKAMARPEAGVVLNEARKMYPLAMFLVTSDGLGAMYTAHKLTVSKYTLGGDAVTHHVDIARDTMEPEDFFTQCHLTEQESDLIKGLLTICESGRLMEKQAPNIYALMRDRLSSMSEGDEDEGD